MLKTGKLPSDLLEKLVFENITFKRKEVITRASIGEDCATVECGDQYFVMSTDPITASIKDIGRLAIHISCNDIASNGVEPVGIMLAVLLPEGTTKLEIEEMMKQAGEASEKIGVEIIGGHTEITSAVNKPVIVSTAVGIEKRTLEQSSFQIQHDDFILMTKTAGLEGAGIIACDLEEELKDSLSEDEIDKGKELLDQVSVVKEGIIAGQLGSFSMHDVTEGGVLGAIWEMCKVGNVGAEVWKEKIPVEDVTKKIAEKYNIDYLRLISSGSMIIIVPPEKKDEVIKKIRDAEILITCIGQIKDNNNQILIKEGNEYRKIQPPASDEIYKVVNK